NYGKLCHFSQPIAAGSLRVARRPGSTSGLAPHLARKKVGARLFDRRVVLLRPDPDAAEGGAQAAAKLGQRVIDMRRNDRVDGAQDEAVTLHVTQGLRQHLLADAAHMPANLGEAERSALLQRLEDQHGPLVGHLANNAAHQFLDRRIDLIRDLPACLVTFFARDRLIHRHSPLGAYRTYRCLLPKGKHEPYLALTQPERTRP